MGKRAEAFAHLIVWSSSPDITVLPSRPSATQLMSAVCPLIVDLHCLDWTSHTLHDNGSHACDKQPGCTRSCVLMRNAFPTQQKRWLSYQVPHDIRRSYNQTRTRRRSIITAPT